MPTKSLPPHLNLDHFKYQAKDLLKAYRSGDAGALSRIREFHPRFHSKSDNAEFALSDAQFVIAREYGFASWPKLRECLQNVESFTCPPLGASVDSESLADTFLRLACLTYGADHPSRRERARELWEKHSEIRGSNLYVAAATGDVASACEILSQNPQLAKLRGGPHGWEPLLYLAYSRFSADEPEFSPIDTARRLLSGGGDPNAGFLADGGIYLFTALTGVFGEGEAGPKNQPRHPQSVEIARLLLNAGANPNDGQTLYNRQFTPGTEHLELLFAHGLGGASKGPWAQRLGGKIDSPEKMLGAQLQGAVENNFIDRVKLLVDHGVAVDTAREGQRTFYELALTRGNLEIADYLLRHGATQKTLEPIEEFAAACIRGDRGRVKELLEIDSSWVEKLGDRRTVLFIQATQMARLDAVRLMVELGFDPSAIRRTSALHEAAWQGQLEMAQLLVELGADVNLRDTEHNGRPLDWARYNQQLAVVDFLTPLTEIQE